MRRERLHLSEGPGTDHHSEVEQTSGSVMRRGEASRKEDTQTLSVRRVDASSWQAPGNRDRVPSRKVPSSEDGGEERRGQRAIAENRNWVEAETDAGSACRAGFFLLGRTPPSLLCTPAQKEAGEDHDKKSKKNSRYECRRQLIPKLKRLRQIH